MDVYSETEISKVDYLVAFLLIACGGNPLITEFRYYVFVTMAMMLCLCMKYNRPLGKPIIRNWMLFYIVWAVIQIMSLPILSIQGYFNHAAKLFTGFLMVSFLGDKFRYAYFKVMTVLALLSLILWSLMQITQFNIGIPVGPRMSLLVWTYIPGETSFRNCGMFWEPGAFQGYLLIIPILFLENLRELFFLEKRSCLILVAALLTTFSTTGYIVFGFLILMYVIFGMKNVFAKVALGAIVVFGSIYAFSTLDFLGGKIEEQFEASQSISYDQTGVMVSRTGTMYIDIDNIKRNPVIGNGYSMVSRYGIFADIMSGGGNGLTGMINLYGIPFSLLFVLCLYKRHPARSIFIKISAIAAILLVFYGENFINYLTYWSLLFATYCDDDYLIYKKV